MDRVKDKVIVITGAASGLGLADSRVLAHEGGTGGDD
jgi:NADP-dependent 3-hydroxy acid dehydrogenase YdfG